MKFTDAQMEALELPDRTVYANYLAPKLRESYPQQAEPFTDEQLKDNIIKAYEKITSLSVTKMPLIYQWVVWDVLLAPGVIDDPTFVKIIRSNPERANERAEDLMSILNNGAKQQLSKKQ
jgi:hypothetical protein